MPSCHNPEGIDLPLWRSTIGAACLPRARTIVAPGGLRALAPA
jgi:hypothetical protein